SSIPTVSAASANAPRGTSRMTLSSSFSDGSIGAGSLLVRRPAAQLDLGPTRAPAERPFSELARGGDAGVGARFPGSGRGAVAQAVADVLGVRATLLGADRRRRGHQERAPAERPVAAQQVRAAGGLLLDVDAQALHEAPVVLAILLHQRLLRVVREHRGILR